MIFGCLVLIFQSHFIAVVKIIRLDEKASLARDQEEMSWWWEVVVRVKESLQFGLEAPPGSSGSSSCPHRQFQDFVGSDSEFLISCGWQCWGCWFKNTIFISMVTKYSRFCMTSEQCPQIHTPNHKPIKHALQFHYVQHTPAIENVPSTNWLVVLWEVLTSGGPNPYCCHVSKLLHFPNTLALRAGRRKRSPPSQQRSSAVENYWTSLYRSHETQMRGVMEHQFLWHRKILDWLPICKWQLGESSVPKPVPLTWGSDTGSL